MLAYGEYLTRLQMLSLTLSTLIKSARGCAPGILASSASTMARTNRSRKALIK